jgi:hypothetical protein
MINTYFNSEEHKIVKFLIWPHKLPLVCCTTHNPSKLFLLNIRGHPVKLSGRSNLKTELVKKTICRIQIVKLAKQL